MIISFFTIHGCGLDDWLSRFYVCVCVLCLALVVFEVLFKYLLHSYTIKSFFCFWIWIINWLLGRSWSNVSNEIIICQSRWLSLDARSTDLLGFELLSQWHRMSNAKVQKSNCSSIFDIFFRRQARTSDREIHHIFEWTARGLYKQGMHESIIKLPNINCSSKFMTIVLNLKFSNLGTQGK